MTPIPTQTEHALMQLTERIIESGEHCRDCIKRARPERRHPDDPPEYAGCKEYDNDRICIYIEEYLWQRHRENRK